MDPSSEKPGTTLLRAPMDNRIQKSIYGLLCLCAVARPALAQGFQNEIQVFANEIQKPGELGLDLHVNSIREAPGSLTPYDSRFERAWNVIPEFAYGLTPSLELGLYLPTSIDASGHTLFAGPEVRLKWLPVHPQNEDDSGPFLGLNGTISRQNRSFAESRVEAGLIAIAGYRGPSWLFAVNPAFAWPLSDGQQRGTPDFSTAWKAVWVTGKGVSPGLEFYAVHGPLNQLNASRDQQQVLYLTLDADRRPWVFDLGVGRGLTPASDRWTVKLIFEIPI